MAKAPAGQPAPDDKGKQPDPVDDMAAGEAGNADVGTGDDGGEKTPPVKPPKTYTKTELDAATAKAAADAIKKANDEKDLSDLEKANNRIKELEGQTRLRDAKDSVVEALTKAGAKSPDLFWKTLQGDLEFDESGKVKNLDVLLTGLKTDHPDQFGTDKPGETIDGGAGGKGSSGTAITKEALAKMTPVEIQKLPWDDVAAAMAK